jgi:hypothetical protein
VWHYPPSKSVSKEDAIVHRAFQPTLHGFNFRNSFSGYPIPVDIPHLPPPSENYGLCGGMSAAACDFFAADRPIPESQSVPAKGTRLYDYLYQRQLATLGESGAYILRFLAWMALPDDNVHGVRGLTYRDELPAIRGELDQDRPAVIGLVYVSSKESMRVWENHQVVAYAVTEPSNPDTSFALRIYDPNLPNRDDITISCKRVRVARLSVLFWSRNVYGLQCVQHVPGKADRQVRGLFMMRHSRRTPPADL